MKMFGVLFSALLFPLISQASEDLGLFPSRLCKGTHVLNSQDEKLKTPFGLGMDDWLALPSVGYAPRCHGGNGLAEYHFSLLWFRRCLLWAMDPVLHECEPRLSLGVSHSAGESKLTAPLMGKRSQAKSTEVHKE